MYNQSAGFINDNQIWDIIKTHTTTDPRQIREILSKGVEMKGLDLEDVAALTCISDLELLDELFRSANFVKETIYGKRLVLFAPLYISNLCANECLYCAFR